MNLPEFSIKRPVTVLMACRREPTFAAFLALALVYMVMASQFESLRDPFIILFSIPPAAAVCGPSS